MSETASHRRRQASSAVWRAADLVDPTRWTIELTDEQRREIIAATRRAIAAGVTLDSITRNQFPLPTMAVAIDAWTAQLAAGRGFLLLREFPVDELSSTEIELAFLGLGTHLGVPVGQNKVGDVLTHIRDERLPDTSKVRLYRTNQRQDFHTDGADIIGLLCLHRAQRGGESRIVSTGALYNEILDRRPDLLEVLHQPMYWDRQGEHAPDEDPWFAVAPFADVAEEARVFYIGWYIRDAQQHADVPRLTNDQRDAMDLIESIANNPTFHVEMDFQPGDIQLLNNARILHSREAYDDADDPDQRRHLLRLWLAAHTFSSVEDELRAGIPSATRS